MKAPKNHLFDTNYLLIITIIIVFISFYMAFILLVHRVLHKTQFPLLELSIPIFPWMLLYRIVNITLYLKRKFIFTFLCTFTLYSVPKLFINFEISASLSSLIYKKVLRSNEYGKLSYITQLDSLTSKLQFTPYLID